MNENFKNIYLGILRFNVKTDRMKDGVEIFAQRCKSSIRLFTLGRRSGKTYTILMALSCEDE